MLDSADLGVWNGPINTAVSCCADDVLNMTDDPDKLQCLLDMARYRVKYGAAKTKVAVTGPAVDQVYYKKRKPWSKDGEQVHVLIRVCR